MTTRAVIAVLVSVMRIQDSEVAVYTHNYCIRYGGEARNISSFVCDSSFICVSDASFADNSLDRKSSQGYLMKLFGGAVAWRANKQDTVTTSSTEAELLAVSQTAKEAIYLSRLMKALKLVLPEAFTIECDNLKTIRLLVDKAMKLRPSYITSTSTPIG